MRDSPPPFARIAAPLRTLAHRFAFVTLVVAAFAVMLLGKADALVVDRLRIMVADALTPILGVMAVPAGAVADALDNLRELATLRQENERLRQENERLIAWLARARQLEAENLELKALLDFVSRRDATQVSARVVAGNGSLFVRSLLVNAGTRDGVRKGQAAVAGAGLVGRVVAAGARSARVLLITDLNSRVPVLIEATRERSVLVGDNTERPRLHYLPDDVTVEPGARVVTSGHGGVFPPGLPVGVVAPGIEEPVHVRPFVDLHRLAYIRLMNFGLGGVPDAPGDEPSGAGP